MVFHVPMRMRFLAADFLLRSERVFRTGLARHE